MWGMGEDNMNSALGRQNLGFLWEIHKISRGSGFRVYSQRGTKAGTGESISSLH